MAAIKGDCRRQTEVKTKCDFVMKQYVYTDGCLTNGIA